MTVTVTVTVTGSVTVSDIDSDCNSVSDSDSDSVSDCDCDSDSVSDSDNDIDSDCDSDRLYCIAVCAHRIFPASKVRPSLRRFSQNSQIRNNVMYRSVILNSTQIGQYRGADKSIARTWRETSYSDQNSQHCTNTYGVQTTSVYCCCLYSLSVVSLGRSSLSLSRVGLRTYQHPGKYGSDGYKLIFTTI